MTGSRDGEGRGKWQEGSRQRPLSFAFSASCFAACQAADMEARNVFLLSPTETSIASKLRFFTMLYHACNRNSDTWVLQEVATIIFISVLGSSSVIKFRLNSTPLDLRLLVQSLLD